MNRWNLKRLNAKTGGHFTGTMGLGSLQAKARKQCQHLWEKEEGKKTCVKCNERRVFSNSKQCWFRAYTDAAFNTPGFFE
jgi:hypothetical protein